MTHRGILACVLLLCVASAADAQRFGIRLFRPPPPPVVRPVAPMPVLRPTVDPNFTPTPPTNGAPAGTFTATTSTDTTATDTKPSGVDYSKPIPATKPPSDGGWWVLAAIAGWAKRERPTAPPSDAPPLFTDPPPPPPAETVLVRVVSVPAGEAPEWVRQAWVGLVLPAFKGQAMRGRGVLTGARSFAPAYQVSTAVALNLLELGNQTAAAEWWRQNTPAANDPSERFLFDTDCCQLL